MSHKVNIALELEDTVTNMAEMTKLADRNVKIEQVDGIGDQAYGYFGSRGAYLASSRGSAVLHIQVLSPADGVNGSEEFARLRKASRQAWQELK